MDKSTSSFGKPVLKSEMARQTLCENEIALVRCQRGDRCVLDRQRIAAGNTVKVHQDRREVDLGEVKVAEGVHARPPVRSTLSCPNL